MSTALTTEDAATAKQNNGLATVVAVAQAQRQTAQARYTLAAAEGAERTARANLIAALGVPAAAEIDVVDSSELPLPPAPADSVSKAVDQALAHRPDVIAALGKVDAAEAELKGERRSYYPHDRARRPGFSEYRVLEFRRQPLFEYRPARTEHFPIVQHPPL